MVSEKNCIETPQMIKMQNDMRYLELILWQVVFDNYHKTTKCWNNKD